MRTHLFTVLCMALLAAGCIGVLQDGDDRLDEAAIQGLDEPVTESVSWSEEGATSPWQRTIHLDPPADVGGVFIAYEASAEGSESRLTLRAEHPNGATYTLAEASGSTAEGWVILPGFEATRTTEGTGLEVIAEGQGRFQLDGTVHLDPPVVEPQPVTPTGPETPTVVAIVDTGINPYHDVFQRPHLTTENLPERIQDAKDETAPLSIPTTQQATYTESLQDDAAAWTHVPDNELVHFEGTNVLGYELRDRDLPQLPVIDQAGHGTAVAHAVIEEDPDAIVTMITADDYDEGVRWAASQPWIDLISLSWGPAVNTAGAAEPHATGFETYDATRDAHEQGKIVFTATGNDPTPAFTDTTSGPPWVHAVSGAEPDAKGRAIMSGNLVDTVANWTQTRASYQSTNDTFTASGTSFATPTTAGIAAKILHDVRTQTGHEAGITDGAMVDKDGTTVTNSDLRDALNRTARYWETTDYEDPTPGPSLPAAPLPWINMGWGYLDGTIAQPATEALLGHTDLPEKPAEAQAYMQANLDLRETWWHDAHQG